ncbi:integrase core domain-containing protein [Pauljensenia sp. UMB3104]|uniref:integrase core domain-containing protein n=1 Tax=Pauljensenia sp. UMB3104 TaxID=3046331 RepID=UPI00254C203F|nr:integrase core domain-containing protein [Pauljensenia sp. UMB3104]
MPRDAHSRRVLGYAMGEQQSTDLVITALDMAATTRGGFPRGVVLHADRGTQFTSQKLADYMRAVHGTVSMGQAGVCWDNAMAESFWATLKTEYYYRRAFTTRDQVYTGVVTWIEDFYNRRRIHTSLGGKSPSNTNYTKRPGEQPHIQTVNNLHTGPVIRLSPPPPTGPI